MSVTALELPLAGLPPVQDLQGPGVLLVAPLPAPVLLLPQGGDLIEELHQLSVPGTVVASSAISLELLLLLQSSEELGALPQLVRALGGEVVELADVLPASVELLVQLVDGPEGEVSLVAAFAEVLGDFVDGETCVGELVTALGVEELGLSEVGDEVD